MQQAPLKKRILRAIGRVVLRFLMFIVRLLPLSTALAIGRGMGFVMRTLGRKRYRVALKNLDIAYGDTMPQAEKERIARESFKHFGMFAIEVLKFADMTQEEVNTRFQVEQGPYEDFQKLMEKNKGCLLITGHIGNFEIAGRWIVPRGYEVIALAREARDQGTTDMMTKAREKSGVQVVNLGRSLKPVIAGLKRNACIAIICDQNAADVFVPFFGHPTGTVDGPARIALKMGAPMVFFYTVRDGKGGYWIRSNGEYWPESTGDEKADIERTMAEVNLRLEQIIRKNPEQWLWFHDRWKSSPGVKEGVGDRV
jgi:KDO2-lipid IV(A) lauroyltransferase